MLPTHIAHHLLKPFGNTTNYFWPIFFAVYKITISLRIVYCVLCTLYECFYFPFYVKGRCQLHINPIAKKWEFTFCLSASMVFGVCIMFCHWGPKMVSLFQPKTKYICNKLRILHLRKQNFYFHALKLVVWASRALS